MIWHHKYSIDAGNVIWACHMISDNQLALCMTGHVDVYEVGMSGASHLYRVAPEIWKDRYVSGVAVSDSSPGSMFVICDMNKNVYQCPCEESMTIINKYRIKVSDMLSTPRCIYANSNTAVVGMTRGKSLIVCKLPEFTQQSHITLDIDPRDLTLSTNHLMVVCGNEIVVKSLDDVRQDVCRITPHGAECKTVCHRHNGRELYVGCEHLGKGCVYKYTWDGVGKPQYVSPIIDGIGEIRAKRLSVTSGGSLAVGQVGSNKVLIYKLQLISDIYDIQSFDFS